MNNICEHYGKIWLTLGLSTTQEEILRVTPIK